MSELMITVQQSAKVLRMWLEPIEQILIDHGWTRVVGIPNIWVNQKGETSFLAEALRGLIAAATAQHEARVKELEAERQRDAIDGQAALDEANNLIIEQRRRIAELEEDKNELVTDRDRAEAERDILAAEVRRCWRAEEALTRSMYEPLEWLQRYADIRALKEQRPAAVRELLKRVWK